MAGPKKLTKTANELTTFSEKELKELRRCADDPIYMMENFMKVLHPVKGEVAFKLYPYQHRLIKSYKDHRKCIALTGRQLGKTECTVGFLLWYAMFNRGATILIAANKYKQALEIMKRIRFAYESLPDHIRAGVKYYAKETVEFDNGSSIQSAATTENTGRGMSITVLYLDEFAFVPPGIAKEFWTSISPTLACVAGDTLVLGKNGYERIDEYHRGKEIGDYFDLEIDVWAKNGFEKTSKGYVSPKSDTLIIETRKGFKVEVTPDHPMYKLVENGGEMTPSQDLMVGDYLRISHSMNVYGDDTLITENMAYILGGYTAEGHIYKNHTIYVDNTDDDFRNVYLNNDEIKTFGICPSRPTRLRCHSVDMVRFFEICGVVVEDKAHQKTIPSKILQSPKHIQCLYLRGLFDGDGSVGERGINLTSTSRRLIQEVQLLLLNMGIVADVILNDSEKIMERERKSGRLLPQGKPVQSLKDSWGLYVARSQYKKFSDLIGFGIRRKQDKLDYFVEKYNQDDRKVFEIPTEYVENGIRQLVEDFDKPKHYFRKNGLRLDRVLEKCTEKRYINQAWMLKFYELIDQQVDWIENDFIGEIFWDQIVSITPSTNRTYDFTCPDTHSFLQNGILGSNTGGKCLITSTPNNNDDQYAQIWKGAITDLDEYGNKIPGGVGKNGFFPILVPWHEHPDRDEEWAAQEESNIGSDRFAREHNCRFVSMDETLIAGAFLENLYGTDPMETDDRNVRYYHPIKPNHIYLVGLDPSMGVGGDDAAIQVFQLPDFKQVAEWKHNKTDIKGQVKVLMHVLHKIYREQRDHPAQLGDPMIYWTVENNGGYGEAALIVINDTGEENFPGEFVQEPFKSGGARRRIRSGLNTTNRNKLNACSRFKSLFESERMEVYSHGVVKQMKNFVTNGASFAAKTGEHDDLISATLLCIRMMEIVQQWDEDFSEKLKETIDTDDLEVEPLPMSFMF